MTRDDGSPSWPSSTGRTSTGGAELGDRLGALLARGPRVSPDAAARGAFDQIGNPTGNVRVPTITLHTKADPLVLVQNEAVFADRVKRSPDRAADIVQIYTVAPATFSPPAPYGAGHCNFTTRERVAVITLLDGWVRHGAYPAPAAITAAFAHDPGLDLLFRPGPWPAPGTG